MQDFSGVASIKGPRHTMTLRIVSTTKQLIELKSAWQSLTQEPLRSFDWNLSWWMNFGDSGELRTYCFEQEGRILGIAPFFIDRWMGQQRLRFLGSGTTCSDYAEIIATPEARSDFVAAIVADIQSSRSIGMVELEGIRGVPTDELVWESIGQPIRGEPFWQYACELEPTWVLGMPASWEQFLSCSNKSLRRKVRKAVKRLDVGELVVRSTLDGLNFESAFDALVDLHQQRFVSKGQPGVFSDVRFTRFLKSALDSLRKMQRAEILVGYAAGEPIVAQLYLISDTGPQLYQSGVRTDQLKLEPGHTLFAYAIRRAIGQGYPVFDFLRGSESYKPYWGAVPQRLLKVRCVSRQLGPTVINQTYRFLRTLKHRCVNLLSEATPSP